MIEYKYTRPIVVITTPYEEEESNTGGDNSSTNQTGGSSSSSNQTDDSNSTFVIPGDTGSNLEPECNTDQRTETQTFIEYYIES